MQDVDEYAARDQARPKRDAYVGMLPPKLAQTLINNAYGNELSGEKRVTVLDPFVEQAWFCKKHCLWAITSMAQI